MSFSFQRLLFGLLLVLCGPSAFAQAPEQDCINAIPVCQPTYVQNVSYTNTGVFPAELTAINQGCLSSGERNDVWYVINVTSPGNLEFTITPNNLNDDYDFALWNVTGIGCSALYNYTTNTANPYPPVRCNYSGVSGATGISSTITGPQWDIALPVLTGQTYVLNVSNFTGSQSGYTLSFLPSTASIYDTVKPKFISVYSRCSAPTDTLLITMTEPVKCNSITPTASDFYLTGTSPATIASATGITCFSSSANATSQQIRLILSAVLAPGNYWLHSNTGTDNNTLLDNCGNSQPLTDSILFSIALPTGPDLAQTFPPSCTGVKIRFGKKFKCSTVALNGSDFQITGPEPVTITSAKVLSCDPVYNIADTVVLTFSKSIFIPGTYTITTKVGTDGNGVLDTCLQPTTNSLAFDVSDQGLITADADPNILCEPGYVNLNSAPPYPLPPAQVACGPYIGNLPNGTPVPYTVGTGTAGSTTNTPFFGFWHDMRGQYLYLASDLQAAGLTKGALTSLSFFVTTKSSTIPYNGFTLKLGCTNINAIPSNNYDVTTPMTTVWTGTHSSVAGANTFTFPTAYNWDGVSNLLLEVCFDNTAWTQYDGTTFSTTTYNSSYVRFQDGGVGCNTTTPLLSSTNNQSQRPNVTFTHLAPPPSTFDQNWTPSLYVEDTTSFATRAYVPKTTTFQIQIIDSNGCYRRAKDEVIVSVRNPELYSVDTSICIGESTPLRAGPATTYAWYPQDGSLSCTDCAEPIATPLATTTYSVVMADQYGCTDTLSVTVFVDPLPNVDAGRDTAFQWGEGIQLYVNAPGGRYYQWEPPSTLNNANIVNPFANPDLNTTYTVFVIDTNGCKSLDSVRVRVIKDAGVGIPDAFTPNGDGVNDEFRVALLRYQRVTEFRVYDRFGRQVWAANPGNGNMTRGWNGRYPDGKEAAVGTYNYIVRLSWPDGSSKMMKGTVTLLR